MEYVDGAKESFTASLDFSESTRDGCVCLLLEVVWRRFVLTKRPRKRKVTSKIIVAITPNITNNISWLFTVL